MQDTLLRQWAMLRLIPRAPQKLTAKILQAKLAEDGFAVSERTIQRDLQSLSTLFPLRCNERDKPYGWYWPRDGRVLDIPGMDPQTALTFKLADTFLQSLMPRSTLAAMAPYMEAAGKVLGALPGSDFATWPDKVRVIPRGQRLINPEFKPEVLAVVYQALFEERRFGARYRPRGAGQARDYEINPLGLVFRDGTVYLVCTLWEFEDIKQLSLHRMSRAVLTDKAAKRLDDFDLDTYIRSAHFDYPLGERTLHLEALFEPVTAQHLQETPLSADQAITGREDGRVLVTATVANTAQLRWWLLGFGNKVEVLAPHVLREEFAGMFRELVQRYQGEGREAVGREEAMRHALSP